MNCCDEYGKCICNLGGKPEGRSCEELGVCQGIKPIPVAVLTSKGCNHDCNEGRNCICSTPIERVLGVPFAPGVVEGYKAPFFGSPAQRRELVRQAKRAAVWTLLLMLTAFSAGLIAGGF